jgi:hypothetical protein
MQFVRTGPVAQAIHIMITKDESGRLIMHCIVVDDLYVYWFMRNFMLDILYWYAYKVK